MKQAHAPWAGLASYCASLEDAPFLEQKFSSMVIAIEFFVRNCLIEAGQPEDGGTLPTADNAEFRLLFDKWRLFLVRRVLIRLGYAGKVVSPHKGIASDLRCRRFLGRAQ